MHQLLIGLAVYAVIFPAELPDKTALASLVLGTRYRPSLVLFGMMAAFTVHVVIAIAAGSLLHLLPHRALEAVVAALFLIGAILLLRGRHEEEEGEEALERRGLSPPRVVFTSFAVIFVAEFGDLTQIVTANLAAKYHDPIAVGLGAVLALWSVGALAIFGGSRLIERVPLQVVTRIAAMIMAGLSVYSIVQAVRG
ncbi:MAG TPA: TMEM165/GDT1 family protein [Micromonosporaceae bacterium]